MLRERRWVGGLVGTPIAMQIARVSTPTPLTLTGATPVEWMGGGQATQCLRLQMGRVSPGATHRWGSPPLRPVAAQSTGHGTRPGPGVRSPAWWPARTHARSPAGQAIGSGLWQLRPRPRHPPVAPPPQSPTGRCLRGRHHQRHRPGESLVASQTRARARRRWACWQYRRLGSSRWRRPNRQSLLGMRSGDKGSQLLAPPAVVNRTRQLKHRDHREWSGDDVGNGKGHTLVGFACAAPPLVGGAIFLLRLEKTRWEGVHLPQPAGARQERLSPPPNIRLRAACGRLAASGAQPRKAFGWEGGGEGAARPDWLGQARNLGRCVELEPLV
jgi:hypothetical protein